MPRLNAAIRFGTGAICDACDLLSVAHERLAGRRAAAPRQLARDIEALADEMLAVADERAFDATFTLHDLGEGFFEYAPPPAVPALLRRARALGVI